MERVVTTPGWEVFPEIERYAIVCWCCESLSYLDYEEQVPFRLNCWRCGAIVNGEL